MTSTDFRALVEILARARIDFIIIGGIAATIHGSGRATFDLDIVYGRSPHNLQALVEALAPLRPYLRGAPPGLPFAWDVDTLKRGLNFTLDTSFGSLGLLGDVGGGGGYEALSPMTMEVELFGHRCRCIDLQGLIALKRAAGRPKDLEVLAELEAIRDRVG